MNVDDRPAGPAGDGRTLGDLVAGPSVEGSYGGKPWETDRAFHERLAREGQASPEAADAASAALDARYHDDLLEGSNCRLCGIEHAPVNPTRSFR